VIFLRTTLNNVGPYLAEWGVTWGEGVNAVVGEYESSDLRSNRSGKSYLAVAVPLYVFFGEFHGRTLDQLPHRLAAGKEDAWAELEVSGSDGRMWTVRRGRARSGDPIRELNGSAVGEQDLRRVVEGEILGLSLEEYRLTNAFVQGDAHGFMRLSPADKRRVVAPWFRTDRWIPRADLAQKRLSRAQADLRALDAEEQRLQEAAARLPDLGSAEVAARVTAGSARGELADLLRECAEVRAQVDGLEVARRARRELEREVARLGREVETERAAALREVKVAETKLTDAEAAHQGARNRAERVQALEEREAKLEDLRAVVTSAAEEVRRTRADAKRLEEERSALRDRLRELERTRTGLCPVLREACDRVARDEGVLEQIRADGTTKAGQGEDLLRSLKALEWKLEMARGDLGLAETEVRELRELRKAASVEQTRERLVDTREKAEAARTAAERAKLGRTELGRALAHARRRLAEAPEVAVDGGAADRLVVLDATAQVAQEAVEEAERQVARASAEREAAEKATSELKELGTRRSALTERIERLAWASWAFGASGIPGRELENAFGVAEDAMNHVLANLGAPTRVRFSPSRELQAWEPACIACGVGFAKGERTHRCAACGTPRKKKTRDELQLEVLDGGSESAFELDSGGGQVLISLGVRLGLAGLPARLRAARCEHLVIDEPDGALDEVNRAALHAMLLKRVAALGFRQVILVTHADVRREFGQVVTVHRFDGEDRSGAWNG